MNQNLIFMISLMLTWCGTIYLERIEIRDISLLNIKNANKIVTIPPIFVDNYVKDIILI